MGARHAAPGWVAVIALVVAGCQGASGPGPLATSRGPTGTLAYLQWTDSTWQVWVLELESGRARQVTRSSGDKTAVDWFPDGRRLLVTTQEGALLEVDAIDGSERAVDVGLGRVRDASLSHAGDRVAFGFDPGSSRDASEIYVSGLDGSGLLQLTRMPGYQHLAAWGPDDAGIYFSSGSDPRVQDVYVIPAKGGTPTPVVFGTGHNFHVDVREDGGVVVSSNRGGDYDLWVYEPGRPARKLAGGPDRESAPCWTDGGRGVAYENSKGGRLDVWWVAAEGGDPIRLTKSKGGARRPAWSPHHLEQPVSAAAQGPGEP